MSANVSSSEPGTFRKRGINLRRVDWAVVLFIGSTHIAALAAPFYFSWTGLALMILFIWVTANLGITLCYHRLLTHRSFKTPKWFEYLLTSFACLAWQGGPIQWVGTHRLHHKYSDEELDPHTPKHGFTWAHMLWCMHKEPQGRNAAGAALDLQRDPGQRLFNKFFWLPQFVLGGTLFAIGQYAVPAMFVDVAPLGASWVLWGICVRTVIVYHGTWFVNSASHTWGYRNYDTPDLSTNLWWVSLLGFGEGWHNNHHAHQRSAAHGLRWYEIDMTYWMIRLLACVGLAKDIVLPAPEDMPS